MNKLKKLVCTACAALCCFGTSGNVSVNGYEAKLRIGEHYRIGSNDFYIQFDVENNKGIAPYCVDILTHNSIPALYSQNDYTIKLCQILLDKCKDGKINSDQIMSKVIDRSLYIKLFNLTKKIKSKKIKDLTDKQCAFDSLIPEVLSLFDLLS